MEMWLEICMELEARRKPLIDMVSLSQDRPARGPADGVPTKLIAAVPQSDSRIS